MRTRNAARVAVGCCGVQLEAAEVFCGALRCVARLWEAKSLGELMLHFFCAQSFWAGYGRWVWEGRTLDLYKKPPDGLERTESGVKWIPEIPGRTLPLASVLQSLERASDSLGVCATRGTSSISDSLLGIEAADVALLVVRVLAAAIPSGVSICAAAGAARLINLIFLIVSILSYIVTGRHARPPSELVPSPWMKPSSRRGGSRTRARLLKATIHPSQTCL